MFSHVAGSSVDLSVACMLVDRVAFFFFFGSLASTSVGELGVKRGRGGEA